MTPQPKSNEPGSFQRGLTTIMQTLCISGIIWLISSVNDIQVRLAKLETSLADKIESVNDMQESQNKTGIFISDMNVRLSRIEYQVNHKTK